jgi:dihydrolipoamide dehydrogenase
VGEDRAYDVVIIGGGPGGYVAGIRAGQLGLRAALVEKAALGGVCLNRGCIPAKTLLRHAEVLEGVRRAGEFGVDAAEVRFDLSRTMKRKAQVVAKLRQGVQGLMKKNNVEVIRGQGRIVAPPMRIEGPVGSVDATGEVEVQPRRGEPRQLQTRSVVVATGAELRALPGLPFDEEVILSTTGAMRLRAVPKRVGVVGGGPGGVEFAYMLRIFGAEDVLLIEALPRILPREDAEISQAVQRSLERRGIRVEAGARATDIQPTDRGVRFDLTTAKDETAAVEVDKLLVSVGITPVTEGLGLDNAGVMRDPKGFIVVDEFMRTSAPGVFAVGDVTPSLPLANVAMAEGIIAVEHLAGLSPRPLDYAKIPRGIYCHPEVGAIGLTEEQAREQGHDVRIGRYAYRNNGRAVLMGHTEGLVKTVSEARYGEILGVHIFGHGATTMLGEAGVALAYEYTHEELGAASHAHPTLAEIIQEAALDAIGQTIHA